MPFPADSPTCTAAHAARSMRAHWEEVSDRSRE
jgi:hypothetical protein